MALTDIEVRKVQAREKPFKLADSGGLYMFVSPSGARLWRLKYRHAGKEKALAIGPYPAVGLAEARRERDLAKSSLKAGRDPVIDQRRRKEAAADRGFEKIAREWFEVKRRGWTPVHANDVITSLERDVFPEIGARDLTDIVPRDILNLLRLVEQRGAIETGHRLRQRIEDVFAFAMGMGVADDNPATVVAKALAPVVRGRQPAVETIEEAREVLKRAEATPAHPVTKLALRFLALTVVRPGVVITTPWEELDQIDAWDPVWRVPAARMKLRLEHKNDPRKDHLVPLPRQALDILAHLRKFSARSEFAFPNHRFAQRAMSENAIGYLLNRAGFHHRHVPHGWRATFSTIMNERNPADRHVIEAILAHVPENKVAAAYNRALYLDRRRELLQEWADMLLEGQARLGDIVKMPRR
ncbi:site-specific recombinase XerD [Ancylobacter aquaticus]|uniref:Site-specific recombinase XerD n=1 Tax=Ancylobacter aquaticus TaxID=100 RepID=A0A4R1HYV8_ANCAQ|nr:integrase arm-type DNA-binding domain-containing protein [Ancylobacter aquaticus]TCK27997.1 site-specific recombinase XerD [Ancylobacter aquaticus]